MYQKWTPKEPYGTIPESPNHLLEAWMVQFMAITHLDRYDKQLFLNWLFGHAAFQFAHISAVILHIEQTTM